MHLGPVGVKKESLFADEMVNKCEQIMLHVTAHSTPFTADLADSMWILPKVENFLDAVWYSHKSKCLRLKENKATHEMYRNIAET